MPQMSAINSAQRTNGTYSVIISIKNATGPHTFTANIYFAGSINHREPQISLPSNNMPYFAPTGRHRSAARRDSRHAPPRPKVMPTPLPSIQPCDGVLARVRQSRRQWEQLLQADGVPFWRLYRGRYQSSTKRGIFTGFGGQRGRWSGRGRPWRRRRRR